jgi:hypothetical protein
MDGFDILILLRVGPPLRAGTSEIQRNITVIRGLELVRS